MYGSSRFMSNLIQLFAEFPIIPSAVKVLGRSQVRHTGGRQSRFSHPDHYDWCGDLRNLDASIACHAGSPTDGSWKIRQSDEFWMPNFHEFLDISYYMFSNWMTSLAPHSLGFWSILITNPCDLRSQRSLKVNEADEGASKWLDATFNCDEVRLQHASAQKLAIPGVRILILEISGDVLWDHLRKRE